jgi:hypothetical protein
MKTVFIKRRTNWSQQKQLFHLATTFRSALTPTPPPIQGVPGAMLLEVQLLERTADGTRPFHMIQTYLFYAHKKFYERKLLRLFLDLFGMCLTMYKIYFTHCFMNFHVPPAEDSPTPASGLLCYNAHSCVAYKG